MIQFLFHEGTGCSHNQAQRGTRIHETEKKGTRGKDFPSQKKSVAPAFPKIAASKEGKNADGKGVESAIGGSTLNPPRGKQLRTQRVQKSMVSKLVGVVKTEKPRT